MAKRPNVFTADTKLWNANGGWRTFPAGETDPGDAWFETEGGKTPGEKTTSSAVAELIAATDQIENLQARLATQDASMGDLAKAKADIDAQVKGLEQAAAEAKKAQETAEALLTEAAKARDAAREDARLANARAEAANAQIATLTAELEQATAPAPKKAKGDDATGDDTKSA